VKVIFSCKTEAVNIHCATNSITIQQLMACVINAFGTADLFELGQYVNDTEDGIDDHHYQLLRLLLIVYLTLCQYHIAKLHTLRLQLHNLRQIFTKNNSVQRTIVLLK